MLHWFNAILLDFSKVHYKKSTVRNIISVFIYAVFQTRTEVRDWKTNETIQPKLQQNIDSCNTLPGQQTQRVVESFIPSA